MFNPSQLHAAVKQRIRALREAAEHIPTPEHSPVADEIERLYDLLQDLALIECAWPPLPGQSLDPTLARIASATRTQYDILGLDDDEIELAVLDRQLQAFALQVQADCEADTEEVADLPELRARLSYDPYHPAFRQGQRRVVRALAGYRILEETCSRLRLQLALIDDTVDMVWQANDAASALAKGQAHLSVRVWRG